MKKTPLSTRRKNIGNKKKKKERARTKRPSQDGLCAPALSIRMRSEKRAKIKQCQWGTELNRHHHDKKRNNAIISQPPQIEYYTC